MISIIVCSREGNLPDALVQNVQTTIGCEFEWVVIDNRNNRHSITEAYNLGIAQSKYPYLLCMHDDIKLHTADWGQKLIAQLDIPGTGIAGVAGSAYAGRIPASWSAGFTHTHFIQSDRTGRKPTENHITQPVSGTDREDVVLLDGVFLAMKKTLAEKLHFDGKIPGFHGYDQDISLAASAAGFQNIVLRNILLEHFSRGIPNAAYYRNLHLIYRKWEHKLPLSAGGMATELQLQQHLIEKKRLITLRNRMLKKGLTLREVQEIVAHWNMQCGLKIGASYAELWLIRLFTSPKHLYRK